MVPMEELIHKKEKWIGKFVWKFDRNQPNFSDWD